MGGADFSGRGRRLRREVRRCSGPVQPDWCQPKGPRATEGWWRALIQPPIQRWDAGVPTMSAGELPRTKTRRLPPGRSPLGEVSEESGAIGDGPTTRGDSKHRIGHPELPFPHIRTPRSLEVVSSGSPSSSPPQATHRQRSARRAASVSCRATWMTSAAKLSDTRPASSYIATLRLLRAAAIRCACSRNAGGSAGNPKRAS